MSDIEKRARELLAAEYVKEGRAVSAQETMQGHDLTAHAEYIALRAIVAALAPPEGYVPERAVLATATRLRRLASAASPLARKAYINAAEDIEMTVSAARPEVT